MERDGTQSVSTAGGSKVISESRRSRVGRGATGAGIGSSVRPREEWDIREVGRMSHGNSGVFKERKSKDLRVSTNSADGIMPVKAEARCGCLV